MKKLALRFSFLLTLVALISALTNLPAAAGGVSLTVDVQSAFLRGAPSLDAPRVGSVFKGQSLAILGRNADNTWVRLEYAGTSAENWFMTVYGTVKGDLNSVPITAAGSAPQAPAAQPTPAAAGAVVNAGSTTILRGVRFTITIHSVYMRVDPNWISDRIGALFKGQTVKVIGRSYDSQWIEIADGATIAWVIASAGKLNVPLWQLPYTEKGQPIVPLTPEAPPAPRSASANLKPEWLPIINMSMQQMYFTYRLGKNMNMFTVAGDCNSDDADYLTRVVAGRFDLTGYDYLNATVARFAAGFPRHSLATHGGLSAATMFDGAWAHPSFCHKGVGNTEGPFPCELRVSQASVVFLAVGTGDHPNWQTFESSYRRMVEYALEVKVLPVLVTKADDLEAQVDGAPSGYINDVIRRLAVEYDVPLMDFWLATRDLPNHGLANEEPAFHLSQEGFDMRTLFMLKVLDLIWRQ